MPLNLGKDRESYFGENGEVFPYSGLSPDTSLTMQLLNQIVAQSRSPIFPQLPNPVSRAPFGIYSAQRPSFIGPAYTMRDGMSVDQAPEGYEYRWRPGVPPSAFIPTPLEPTPEVQFANALLSGDYNPKSNYGESALAARDAALNRNQGLMAAHSIMAGTDFLGRMAPLAGRANRQTQAYNTRVRVNSPLFRSIRDYLVSDRDPQYRMTLPEADRILARAANNRDLVGEITRRMNATPAERAEMKPPSYSSGANPALATTRDDRRRYDALNRLADSGAPRNYPEKKPGILENMRKGFDDFRNRLPKFPQIGKPPAAQPAAGGAPSRLLDSRGNPMPSTGAASPSQTPPRPLTTFTPGSPRFNGTPWRQPGAGVWNPATTGAGALNLNNPALATPYSDPLNTWNFQGRPTPNTQTPAPAASAAAAKPATDPITAAIDAAIAGAPSGGYDTGYIDRLRADQGAALDAMYNAAFQEQGSHQAKADQTWDEMQAHQNQAPPRIEPLNMFYTMLAGNVAKVLNPNLNTDQQMQSLVNNKLSGMREQRQQQYQLLAEKYRRAGDLADKAGDSARAIKLYKNADMMTNQINALETRAQRDAERQNNDYWKRQELQLRREQQREQFAQEGYQNAMEMLENQTAAMLKLDQEKPEVQFRLAQLGVDQQMLREALANAKGGWSSIQYPGQYGRVERALRTVLPRWKNDPRKFWKETGFDKNDTLLQYGVKRSEIIDYMNRNGLTIPNLKTWLGTDAPDVNK